jgi:hypothetical protein
MHRRFTIGFMELHAIFETWHLGDGNYPPLSVGELANLSFELSPDEVESADAEAQCFFHHRGHAIYEFTGNVIRVYGGEGSNTRLVVIESDGFRFYINSMKAARFKLGNLIRGRGALLFDHYLWVEYLSDYLDPPDLFYTLRVIDIVRYKLPDRFISRSGASSSYPTYVAAEEYSPNDIEGVGAVTDEDHASFIIHFAEQDILTAPIKRTFIS